MPRSIPNTTIAATTYIDANTFAGTDVFEWGYITVANQPVFAQLLEGAQGQAVPQDEQFLPPATYPIVSKTGRPVAGIRFRAVSAATPLPQVFGNLYYPSDPGIQAGTPFTGVLSPSGVIGAGVGIYDKVVVPVNVVGTNLETDLYNKPVAVGDVQSGSIFTFDFVGDYLHNNAAGDTVRHRFYLGATLVLDATMDFAGFLSASRKNWRAFITCTFQATNIQWLHRLHFQDAANIGGPALGQGMLNGTFNRVLDDANSAGVDFSLAQLFRYTVTHSAASGNNSYQLKSALVQKA